MGKVCSRVPSSLATQHEKEKILKVQQGYCYQGMKSVGKGRGSEVFSNKSSRKPKACFALHTHMRYAPSQNGQAPSQPQVALIAPQAQLPCLERGECFVRHRGKRAGLYAYAHRLHSIQEVNTPEGRFWEDDHPARYWRSSHPLK